MVYLNIDLTYISLPAILNMVIVTEMFGLTLLSRCLYRRHHTTDENTNFTIVNSATDNVLATTGENLTTLTFRDSLG